MIKFTSVAFTQLVLYSRHQVFINVEMDNVLGWELTRNLSLSGLSMFLIALAMLRNAKVALLVLSATALTLVDVVGFVHFWGLDIDTIACMSLVINVGLAIDYSMHIAHAFNESKGGVLRVSPKGTQIKTYTCICTLRSDQIRQGKIGPCPTGPGRPQRRGNHPPGAIVHRDGKIARVHRASEGIRRHKNLAVQNMMVNFQGDCPVGHVRLIPRPPHIARNVNAVVGVYLDGSICSNFSVLHDHKSAFGLAAHCNLRPFFTPQRENVYFVPPRSLLV